MPEILLEQSSFPAFVPGELDFFLYEANVGFPSDRILRWLKARMLFFGRIYLPMEFLLFNRPLFGLWADASSRPHFEEFVSDSHLVVSRAEDADLREFVSRHRKALEAGNPAAIQDERAIRYAQSLTHLADKHADYVLFDARGRLEDFEQLFSDELRRLGTPRGFPENFSSLLINEAKALTKEIAPRKAVVDKTAALSRGGLTRVLRYSADSTLRRFRQVIWNFAHIIYLRNVSGGLRNDWQEAQPVISSLRQLDRAVVFDLEPDIDFVEELVRRTRDRLFGVDWDKVEEAPWSRIREIVEATNSAASAYFQARANLIRERTPGNLALLVSSLDTYLSYLQEAFSPVARVTKTAIQLADWGRYVGVGVMAWKLRNEAALIWVPVAVLSAQWAASRAWRITTKAWSGARVMRRAKSLERAVRQCYYEHDLR